MGKFGWMAIGVLAAAFVADQYWNQGCYTDSASAMLRYMKRPFGW
jgi:RimJ/RimL family protein N-acetyltransferase